MYAPAWLWAHGISPQEKAGSISLCFGPLTEVSLSA
jgi:hypothetical protein